MVDSAALKNIEFSSDQDSSCDELKPDQTNDVPFYSSEEEESKIGVTTRNSSRKRLQSLRHSLSDTSSCRSNRSLARQPTRRPDPNTFNRNAIMARENRKKKKEYVEKLEGDVETYKSENKKLRKMLKQQFKMVEKLSHEKSYLRSILVNKSQIMSLIKVIKDANIPLSSSELRLSTVTSKSPSTTVSGLSTTSIAESSIAQCNSLPDNVESFDMDTIQPEPQIWDNLLPFSCDMLQDVKSNVSDEHNYFNTDSEAGVCLHVSGSSISLEFCASCHDKSQSSWLDM